MLTTNKKHIAHLAEICARKGINHVVMCPGSRSAPLVIAFSRNKKIQLYPIVDERSAAYFALGMAQFLKKPVGIFCTSGTAALNFSPAIAEAFYQEIPLLVMTADRPSYLIGQQDGQAINQKNVYQNFIEASFELPEKITDENDLKQSDKIINDAINISISKSKPVHINVPLEEPLYEQEENTSIPYLTEKVAEPLSEGAFKLKEVLNNFTPSENKIMVLLGNGDYDIPDFDEKLFPNIIILKDITANTSIYALNISEPLLHSIKENEMEAFKPDVLFTLGNGIVSKKMKLFLKKYSPTYHYHIDRQAKPINTFNCLTAVIPTTSNYFFDSLQTLMDKFENNGYKELWLEKNQKLTHQLNQYFTNNNAFVDFNVYEIISNYLKKEENYTLSAIHLANSTPVRYASLFYWNTKNIYANRGVSGIDGCTSTAVGYAFASKQNTLLITGDLAFFYDSNALWNKFLPKQLRIIIINNGGGNIFQLINNETDLPELTEYFETPSTINAKGIAETFGCNYYFCENKMALKDLLPKFFNNELPNAAILEIKTDALNSAATYKAFIETIKQTNL